ncbi:MAG: hypothetical protein WCG80_05675 [Spirochaetales bacterium]
MLRAFLLFLPLLVLSACTTVPAAPPTPPGDIGGEWSYTVIDVTNGNTWDKGTIRFHGGPDSGEWDLSNLYDYPEVGTWTRNERGIDLSGDNHWVLRGQQGNLVTGDWDAGASGHGTLGLVKR